MSQSPIELKGSSFTLSVVHLHSTQPEIVRQALKQKIEQAPAFLRNAPIVLNVAGASLDADWPALHKVFNDVELRVIGVSGCQDDTQKQAVLAAGLPLMSEGKLPKKNIPEPIPAPVVEVPKIAQTRIIDTPIRSGQQIYARNGDLIVLGHVSAGAEVIADGNIHIYGIMRGRVLAGANGDVNSQIFCHNLAPELVSIAGQYWLSDKIPEKFHGQAARLFLCDRALTIQSLF